MDDATDPPASNPTSVDVMDVSPAAHPDPMSPNNPLLNPSTDPNQNHPPVNTTSLGPNQTLNDPIVEPPVTAPPVAAIPTDNAALHPHPAPVPNTPQPPATPTASVPAPVPSAPEEDKLDTEFSYVLRKYNTIQEQKVYSPWHHFGYFRWRLLIFPKGNQSSSHDLSVYLECGGPSNLPTPSERAAHALPNHHQISPNGKEAAIAAGPSIPWSRPAKFSLHLVHPNSPDARYAMARDADLADHDHNLFDLDVSESNVNSNVSVTVPATGTDPVIAPAAGLAPNPSVTGVMRDIVKETSHIFRENASDWGFLEFAPFASLQPHHYADAEMNVVIMVKIRLLDNLGDSMLNSPVAWDSRKETGFVGFKNQGATCYMNSLLQTLYMLSAFRKAVYNMPLPEPGNENSGSFLSYALQKVFFELQFSPTVVKTKKLTESFGWDTTDAFTQHDVQELKLILCDELAEKMKKIAPDRPNTLSTLFQGKLLNYIECVNVDYKSTREEHFSDLSLNVRGCRNIYDSFEKYTEVEMMEGDNKYRADGFEELQDAKKGVKFLKLPPVLQLHLKRFEYDFERYAMVKINDRYEFEPVLDLSRFVENSDGTDVYYLHSVLVHIGDVNGGHYHVFIRPEIDVSDDGPKKPAQWFKFDDENVSPATEEAAIQDNFGVGGKELSGKGGTGLDDDLGGVNGGQTPPPSVFQTRTRNYQQTRRFSNAYMLQYLRKSNVPYLLKPPDDSDVPKELGACINKEREEDEQRKRNRAEQHLYMNIAVAVDRDMVEHHGSDLVQWDKVRQLRVKRALQLGELKRRLQNEGIVQDARRMRLWKCLGRHNDTVRPDSLVANGLDTQPITDPSSRDHLTQTAYNVALYSGRHGYYGQEEAVRMYAEDFCSPYCLGAGQAYSDATSFMEEWNRDHQNGSVIPDDNPHVTEMETDSVKPMGEPPMVCFQLEFGKEVLLFLKYYSPDPVPRLQWLGHIVVDRASTVLDLHPLLKRALETFRKKDPSLPRLRDSADIAVYEEVAATNVAFLAASKTLEDQKIPFESGSGDILVFQQFVKSAKEENSRMIGADALDGPRELLEWDGLQEMSRGDDTDLPLGGRPLSTVRQYYDYLAYRIKIEFRDKCTVGGPDETKAIFFDMLRKDTYLTARRVLAGVLGENVDPDYIRFFSHDLNREAPAHEPVRLCDSDELQRVLHMHNLVTSTQPEYRILWYERTEYHIAEFEQKDEVRVCWRHDGGTRATPYSSASGVTQEAGATHPSGETIIRADLSVSVPREEAGSKTMNGTAVSMRPTTSSQGSGGPGDGSKSFSVLVPLESKFADVIDQVRSKLRISADVNIRMFEVKNSKIFRFISPGDSVPALMTGPHDYGVELRAEPVPEDETDEALGTEYEMMTVLHLSKDKGPRAWRGLTFFGVPFVIKVRKEGESVKAIRKRIQKKLGVPQEEFDQWPLAEIVQLKVVYLNDAEMIYSPHARVPAEFCSLAIEHKSTAPTKKASSGMSRYADKPLKIRS